MTTQKQILKQDVVAHQEDNVLLSIVIILNGFVLHSLYLQHQHHLTNLSHLHHHHLHQHYHLDCHHLQLLYHTHLLPALQTMCGKSAEVRVHRHVPIHFRLVQNNAWHVANARKALPFLTMVVVYHMKCVRHVKR